MGGGHCSGGAQQRGCIAGGGAPQRGMHCKWGAARAPGVAALLWVGPGGVPQSLSPGVLCPWTPLGGPVPRRGGGGPGPAGRVPAGGAARPRMAPRGAPHATASPTATGGPQPAAPRVGRSELPPEGLAPRHPPTRGVGQRGFTPAPRLQLGISVMSCAGSASDGAGEPRPTPAPSPSHASHVGEGRATAITRGLPMNREGNRGGGSGRAGGGSHVGAPRDARTPGIWSGSASAGSRVQPCPPRPPSETTTSLPEPIFSPAQARRGSGDPAPRLGRGCQPGRGTEGAGTEVGGGGRGPGVTGTGEGG